MSINLFTPSKNIDWVCKSREKITIFNLPKSTQIPYLHLLVLFVESSKKNLFKVSTEECCSLANEWNIPYMETSAKNSTIVNSLFTEVVKEMNFKLFTSSVKKSRKEKKKFKKLNNLSLNSNVNIKSQLSPFNSSGHENNKDTELMRLKKANYEKSITKCSLLRCCRACICIGDSHKPRLKYEKPYDFYDADRSSKCSIL